ncbi:Fructose dehydrogenase large subunit [Aquisphaera giovannonii]|uniref:Fructose dehydrogenase large subunit n=1 Tax=Aquisphaera giovannonii TaxID=406548 RepID=A0A5B9VZA7_9BACT|nr:GMC family oxidoreductase [Aquisphaera giovannonii]QEH33311.1 Fructose dehydrogenase large subunit [Aquisphaera giovannonii]
MIIDARSVPTGSVIEADVCIVGGGAAGITLAREFANSSHRVILLESGGTEREQATQDLYAGSVVGQPYDLFPESRLRYFGGTTNHWGRVWCDLPHSLDFEEREGVPHTGWPVSLSHLEPWYWRAQSVLKFGPSGYELSEWGIEPAAIPGPFRGPHFVTRVLQQAPATRFGREFAPELGRAKNLSVYLHANGLRFDAAEDGGAVRQVHVGVLPDGRFTVRARIFVVSAGGIENARLLLLSENEAGVGLGNDRGLVGRYFMLHLEYSGGSIEPADPYVDLNFQTGEQGAQFRRIGGTRRFVSYITLSDETRRELKLPNFKVRFQYPRLPEMDALIRLLQRSGRGADMLRDLGAVTRRFGGVTAYLARRVLYGRNKPPAPLASISLNCTSEQMPNPESCVTLGNDLDAFGLRRIVVDWRLTEADRSGMATSNRLLDEELKRAGFGRLRSTFPEGDEGWPAGMHGDQHHMGTTRMHKDPNQGVVDENCRVHGVSNLYAAGSSVFTTGGTFNPTLTIVALALRLADHIKQNI